MERFLEDLKKNRCEVLSLEFVDERRVKVRVKPPRSSSKVGDDEVPEALPNHPVFMLQLRLNPSVEYGEVEPGVYEVRVENPRKPFSAHALMEAAERQNVPFVGPAAAANQRLKKSEEKRKQ